MQKGRANERSIASDPARKAARSAWQASPDSDAAVAAAAPALADARAQLRKEAPMSISRLLALAAVSALAAPAGALADAPPGAGLVTDDQFGCDNGATVIVHSAGPSAWIDDDHYVVVSRTLRFTDGSTDVQTLGQKSGLGDTIECTAVFPSVSIALTLVRVPPATD
jgi:hypothetical protein